MSALTHDPIRAALAETQKRLVVAKAAQSDAQREITRLIADVKRLNEALTHGQAFELRVSEHAMLRYAERVLGFDTNEVLRAVEEQVQPVAFLLGDGKYPIAPGYVAVVVNRTVVTIEPA